MDELLTDQQQAERVKAWIRENGLYILGGVVLGLGGLFAMNWWDSSQEQRAEEASALYVSLLDAMRGQRELQAAELTAQLAEDYGDSPYVDQANLAMAKLYMDRSEPGMAAGYLQRVADESDSAGMVHVARLRLAKVHLQQQQYDEALRVLDKIDEGSAFATSYHEVRGDVYHAMGQADAARREYEAALGAVEPGVIDRAFVQAKLDSLGPAVTPALPVTPEPAADAAE